MQKSKCAGTEFTGWILSFTYHESLKNPPPKKITNKQTNKQKQKLRISENIMMLLLLLKISMGIFKSSCTHSKAIKMLIGHNS